MKYETDARRLDVKAFAQDAGALSGQLPLGDLPRLAEEARESIEAVAVVWSAHGELRAALGARDQVWLHLRAQTALPLTCQRCLGPVTEPLTVDRWFHFVADEATAEALDDESEDDVLALSREFDLMGLLEDELLMALPLVPRHDVCPTAVPLEAKDAAFDAQAAERPHPFAALAGLRTGKSK